MQLIADLLEGTSFAYVALGLFFGMIAAALVGYGIRRLQTGPFKRKALEQDPYVVSAVLGLLALLLGFSFSLAVDRYESRRAMVLEESNVIGTAYLQAQLLEAPYRGRISALLSDYVDNRNRLAGQQGEDFEALMARNDALLVALWRETMAAYPSIEGRPFAGVFISSINGVLDADEARKAARMARVPTPVFMVLTTYISLAAGILGYALTGTWSRASASFLFFLLTLSLLLIIDIDRPLMGTIRESQLPMENLGKFIADYPPASFDAAPGGG